MRMRTSIAFVALAAMAATTPNLAQAVTISTVPIGNPNNTADTGGFGAVAYAFKMGQYEVTNAQYVDFLNAVAKTDTYSLFKDNVPSSPTDERPTQGIVRSGTSGNYTYAIKAASGSYDYTDKPVNWTSVGDAMRFANWMHNGQPTGAQGLSTTEDGAYYLNGATSAAALQSVTRKAGATWWLPSENEWYKAAYYDPSTSTYFTYPTGSNTAPSNSSPPGINSANFSNPQGSGAPGVGTTRPLTTVGAYTSADSPYGTFDQGGNVWEWLETLYGSTTDRVGRGGGWYQTVSSLSKANRTSLQSAPTFEYSNTGFRLATVPEPSSLAMLLFGSIMLWAVGRKRGR